MIRGVFSAAGAVIVAVMLIRVVQGEMSLVDVSLRGLVVVLVISAIDKVIAPMVGAALRGLNVMTDDHDSDSVAPARADGRT